MPGSYCGCIELVNKKCNPVDEDIAIDCFALRLRLE